MTAIAINLRWYDIKYKLPDDLEYILFGYYDDTTKDVVLTAGFKDKDVFRDNCADDFYFAEIPIESVRMWCYLRK